MAAYTTQLGLLTPTQGTLPGQWGDTVNNGITEYVNIAIAGTLSFANDGAVTLANTTGSASASNIGSTTAQYMVIQVTGTLTTTKVITAPSYSKIYLVDNAATGGAISFKRSGQVTPVTVSPGMRVFVYYNGTDYVTVAGGLINLATGVTGVLPAANGGTGLSSPGTAGNILTSDGTGWVSAPNSAIAAAGGSIYVNNTLISTSYTIAAGQNGFSVGPMTIQSPYTVTVTAGQRWVVI
jgi:hypothetical protein